MYQANWKLEENTFYHRDFSKMFWLDFPESVAYVSFSKVLLLLEVTVLRLFVQSVKYLLFPSRL